MTFIRIAIGYFLTISLIISACLLGLVPFAVFVDIPTAALLFGGTLGLLITLLGPSNKEITWLGTPTTIFASVTGISIVMIGIVSLLNNLNDSQNFGPSMAVCLLGIFYTLLVLALVSIPLEDWHNLKKRQFNTVTMSRVVWFLFPISATFFTLIMLAILLFGVSMVQQ